MPKKIMKAAKKQPRVWPMPKRGKARSLTKTAKKPAVKSPVPYVRHGVMKTIDKRKMRHNRPLPELMALSGRNLIRVLRGDGWLRKWEGQSCPHCGQGILSPLHYFADKQVWVHRCGKQGCKKRVQPHDFHPIFFGGSGSSFTSLAMQASILSCSLAGVPVSSVPSLLGISSKPVDRIYTNLELARARHVEILEKEIVFGKQNRWADVEADEVDLGKEEIFANSGTSKLQWEQWGGIVERGRPETLLLYRLTPKLTSKRSPGPGPITRMNWTPIALKHLKDKQVILHTDGARAYKIKVPGIIHDNVVHKKKLICVNGKKKWVKPHYTRVCVHTLPTGKQIKVKAGTQVIDRFWGTLRQGLKNIARKPGSALLRRKIRSIQWTYWHRGQSLLSATAAMLQCLFDL